MYVTTFLLESNNRQRVNNTYAYNVFNVPTIVALQLRSFFRNLSSISVYRSIIGFVMLDKQRWVIHGGRAVLGGQC